MWRDLSVVADCGDLALAVLSGSPFWVVVSSYPLGPAPLALK